MNMFCHMHFNHFGRCLEKTKCPSRQAGQSHGGVVTDLPKAHTAILELALGLRIARKLKALSLADYSGLQVSMHQHSQLVTHTEQWSLDLEQPRMLWISLSNN